MTNPTLHLIYLTAFYKWKEHYEHQNLVKFVSRGGFKKILHTQTAVTYFTCRANESMVVANNSKRQSELKPQGSCNTGSYCTAGIKLITNLNTGQVKAKICHSHYGHPLNGDEIPPYLRVNPAHRKVIINKCREG